MKPIAVTKAKNMSQIKPRLGEGRAGLRYKIKMPVPQLISRPVVEEMEKPVEQSKFPVLENASICDKILPDYKIPHVWSGDDLSSKMVNRKTIQDVSREIPIYPNPVYRPPPKLIKLPMSEVPGSLFDLDPEIDMDFEENLPFQEGVISEMYQRPDKLGTTRIG